MNEPNEDARERLEKILDTHLGQLAEHFDAVQIFATNHEVGGDTTLTIVKGGGNWNARRGMVTEWMTKHDEMARIHARNNRD